MHKSVNGAPSSMIPAHARASILMATIVAALIGSHTYRPGHSGIWQNAFFEAMHVPVFAVVGAATFLLLRRMTCNWCRILCAVLISCFLGALSEVAQIYTPRDASATDLFVDVLAATGGVLLTAGAVERSLPRTLCLFAAVVFLAMPLTPLARISVAIIHRNLQVPTLFLPDTPGVQHFYNLQNSKGSVTKVPGTDKSALMLTFGPGRWPGFVLHDLWPDWSLNSDLELELYVPGSDGVDINIRIDDLEHRNRKTYSDRYNAAFRLTPGVQTVSIPLSTIAAGPSDRKLNLNEVDRVILFMQESAENHKIGVVSIKLR